MIYNVRVVNSRGKEMMRAARGGDADQEYSFTPKNNDTYTIEMLGQRHYGEYRVSLVKP